MKKNLILSQNPILCVMFALCLLFSACSDKNQDPKEEEVSSSVNVTYSFTMHNDFLNLIDATVTFWNDKGEQQTETMTTTTWKKEIMLTNSQEFGYTINIVAKSNIDQLLTKSSYNVSRSYNDKYTTSSGKTEIQQNSFQTYKSKETIKTYIAEKAEFHKYSKKWSK